MTDKQSGKSVKDWFDENPIRYLLIAIMMVVVLLVVYLCIRDKRVEGTVASKPPRKEEIVTQMADAYVARLMAVGGDQGEFALCAG